MIEVSPEKIRERILKKYSIRINKDYTFGKNTSYTIRIS